MSKKPVVAEDTTDAKNIVAATEVAEVTPEVTPEVVPEVAPEAPAADVYVSPSTLAEIEAGREALKKYAASAAAE